ncbi:MAG: PilZ domain-containing protein [Anaerolineales bacterium]|jgi:hypothetical protein
MQIERRKSKRYSVVDLDLFFQDPQEFIGKVINLSEGGLLVITDEQLEKNKFLDVRFLFDTTVNENINFDFTVRVAWSNRSTLHSNKFSTGMEFTENPKVQAQFINQMIKVYGPR